MAPPEIAIINKAEAVFVNLPRPSKVSGQTAGQTNAFAIPRAATKSTDVNPFVSKMQTEKIIPKIALIIKAFFWLKYFGIKNTPTA